MPDKTDESASPGEFAFIEDTDGSLTLVILDPAGSPYPIDPAVAELTVASDRPDVAETKVEGFTVRVHPPTESLVPTPRRGTLPSKGTVPHHKHPPEKPHRAPGSGAVAVITATVTWQGGAPPPYTLSWKVTVNNDETKGITLERSPATDFTVTTA